MPKLTSQLLYSLLISLILLHGALAEEQTLTRELFIDQQIEMLKRAEKAQEQLVQRNIAMLKQTLSPSDFEALMAQEEAGEAAEHQRMAQCLGITESQFNAYRSQFDTEFQIRLVETCAASLPDNINLSDDGWQNSDLSKFQSCAESEVAKVTSISQARLTACSEESNTADLSD